MLNWNSYKVFQELKEKISANPPRTINRAGFEAIIHSNKPLILKALSGVLGRGSALKSFGMVIAFI